MSADRYRGENGHSENSLPSNAKPGKSPVREENRKIWQNESKILNVFIDNLVTYQEEKKMLFDLCILLQNARLHERPGTKQSNMIRSSIRGLRESLIAGQTGQTTDAKPATNELSCNLALSFLLNSDENGPF